MNFGDIRDDICERARAAGMKVVQSEYKPDHQVSLRIYFPNGETPAAVTVSPTWARILSGYEFERWTILGDYAAVYDASRKVIEARILSLSPWINVVYENALIDLPGVFWGPPREPGLLDLDLNVDTALSEPSSRQALLKDRPWSLPLRGPDETPLAEFSNCPPAPLAVDPPQRPDREWNTVGITLLDREFASHDEALTSLEQTSSALFFEMGLRYRMQFSIAERRPTPRPSRRRSTRNSEAELIRVPQMPRVQYQHDAVSLYLHGQSSTQLPLSQFLAYYQSIEYHFPLFVERDLLGRLRNKLRDPGFSPENSAHLNQVIRLVGSNRGGRNPEESQQLTIALSACVDETDLLDFLHSDELQWKAICDKNTVKGVQVINEKNKDFPIIAQVSRRIYQIRCRIVHAKENGGPGAMPMLLPTSPEVRSLWHDINIVRYLAQKVIIAGAES